MGANKSKHETQGQILQAPPKQQQQQPTYHGLPCIYQFLQLEIPFSVQMNLSYLHHSDMQMTMSDPNAYVPYLQQMYNQGFRLLTFQLTPGSIRNTAGFLRMTSTTMLRAQAVFRKSEPMESHEHFSLQVVKSSIESGTFLTGVHRLMQASTQTQTQTQHLYKMIHDHACQGCRLRCIEITGCYRAPYNHMNSPQTMGVGSGMAYGQNFGHSGSMIYGVDLFFEVPQYPNPELYQYLAVPMKLNATCHVSVGFGSANQQWALQLDWQGVMNQYLGSGWRLVEVFDDKSVDTTSDHGFMQATQHTSLNIIFIFEKSQSRMHDNTMVYEGTMIEYNAPGCVSAGFGSSDTVIDTNWNPAIEEMGNNGWELVTILQTPAVTTNQQLLSVKTSSLMWMFFQRRKVESASPLPFKHEGQLTDPDPPQPVVP